MNYYVMTLFPEMIMNSLNYSIIKRAIDNKIINIQAVNIRDFTNNKHNQVDDYPYGGGAGMVIKPQPVYDAYKSISDKINKKTRVLYMTPQGKTFNQNIAEELSKEKDLIILCGHYEGIDERVIEEIVTDEISIGDYILTGGEIASIAVIDAVSRLIPNVLNKEQSYEEESFSNNLLEYPHYTRPREFLGKVVPEILLSGHHKKINEWRKEQSILRTLRKRPELLKDAKLNKQENIFLNSILNNKIDI